MTILFLYTELAGYFAACLNALSPHVKEIHIVRWPVNAEAPFQFNFPENVTIYNRSDFTAAQLVDLSREINPQIIISSGWVDKGYLKICKAFKGKIPTIMGMDNQWHGSMRQQLMRLMAPAMLHTTYSGVWVPGEPQKTYAKKLGFKEEQITTGFYSADVNLFAPEAKVRIEAKDFPRRLVYVGRYIPAKGLDLLFKAFIEVVEQESSEWELWCAGTGDLFDERPIHPKIKHLGFLQPHELKETLRDAGVFILPSRFEPWGVVVHEMAAAGFPMILSDAIGSHTRFLQPGINGYLFANENMAELKFALQKTMHLPTEELKKMAVKSHQLGTSYTPEMWVEKLLNHIRHIRGQ